MKRYETYKDSGIEWIGEIPEHWEVKRLKYIGDSIIGITYNPKDVVQEGGTLVLRSSNIQNGKLSLKDNVYINKDVPEKLETKVGDILICSRNGSRRLIGKNITIDEKTEGETFGAFMTVFRTEQYEFISKYFNSQVFSGQSGLFLTSTINQLTVNTLNNFYTALPPKNERETIAKYLDAKVEEIDNLISQKKKLVKLYEKEKEAIINRAVTKGINPKVKLKDSGIEWLGDIPEHWKVKRLKYIGDSIIGITYSPNDVVQENGTLVLRSSNIQNGKLSLKDNIYINKDIPEKLTTKIGDILICSRNGSRRLIGKNITIDEKTEGETFGAFMTVFRTEQYKFISKYFNSQVFLGQSGLFLTSTINQLTINTLNNFYVALPPEKEQTEIVKQIDLETNTINDKLRRTNNLISLLDEYKTVLISDVVTGKIKVN